ncbi:MAG: UDP-N-acetylmuramate dehydrogenase [Clostridiales bacterium]|nr:UDP-N-acetylmuramate dehydrogenase [Clostridiales bacterium]
MSKHTTFKIGGKADLYAVPTEDELARILKLVRGRGIPVMVIGNGSNILVGDGGVRGLIIEIGSNMNSVHIDEKSGTVTAQAGALLTRVANAVAEAGLTGMEFASGIPGSVGGAVVMNAGAYGGEMKDIIVGVRALTSDGEPTTLSADELELGYRKSSIAARHCIVTEATFSLEKKPKSEIYAKMDELKKKRVEKQPLEFPSAGSTFKRPEGHFAGKLIMDAGLSGYAVGGAMVSKKHCGFVINTGTATASDVKKLMDDVENIVYEKFGVRLEPEVRIIGEDLCD